MKTTLRVIFTLPAILAAAATGCATAKHSIVAKPEIHQIKKIAIISITAPQKVPLKNGKGKVGGWSSENRMAIADQTLAAYSAEFKKLGWELIPSAQLSALPIYQQNFAPKISKASNGLAKALNHLSTTDSENMYFSPTGLYPVTWDDENRKGTVTLDLANLSLEKDKPLKTKMQEVAAQSGADAALFVQADYCYDNGSIWVGHAGSTTGSAVMTGDSVVYAVTKKGVEVVKMNPIRVACGGEHRVASDSTTAMAAGNLLFNNEKIRQMFLEVAKKSAAENVKQIQAAMKD